MRSDVCPYIKLSCLEFSPNWADVYNKHAMWCMCKADYPGWLLWNTDQPTEIYGHQQTFLKVNLWLITFHPVFTSLKQFISFLLEILELKKIYVNLDILKMKRLIIISCYNKNMRKLYYSAFSHAQAFLFFFSFQQTSIVVDCWNMNMNENWSAESSDLLNQVTHCYCACILHLHYYCVDVSR